MKTMKDIKADLKNANDKGLALAIAMYQNQNAGTQPIGGYIPYNNQGEWLSAYIVFKVTKLLPSGNTTTYNIIKFDRVSRYYSKQDVTVNSDVFYDKEEADFYATSCKVKRF